MRWAAIIICLALAPLFGAPTKKPPAKKPLATSNTKVSAGGTVARSHKTARRVSRIRAKPSFQIHPDPDRYQQIQQSLAERGYFKGQVTGQWNDDSVDALRRFQMDQKLPETDGKLDALSLTALGLGPKHGADIPGSATPGTSTSVSSPPPSIPPQQSQR